MPIIIIIGFIITFIFGIWVGRKYERLPDPRKMDKLRDPYNHGE